MSLEEFKTEVQSLVTKNELSDKEAWVILEFLACYYGMKATGKGSIVTLGSHEMVSPN